LSALANQMISLVAAAANRADLSGLPSVCVARDVLIAR